MRSVDRLVKQHDLIEREFNLLAKSIVLIESSRPISDDFPKWAPGFFSQFADKCHHAKEEDRFFTLLKERGILHHHTSPTPWELDLMTKTDSYANRRPKRRYGATFAVVVCLLFFAAGERIAVSAEPVFVWPDLAPGETTRNMGTTQPPRKGENPPVTRVVNIRRPTLDVFLPKKPNGTAILVLPGGGFMKVVPDMEGSEAAPFLNRLGIAVFVLRYRTSETKPADEPAWRRPLQDAQRTLRLIRSKADEWKIQRDRVGVLGFSAGGQVGSILHTADGVAAYQTVDAVDKESCRPDFSLLIYPWQILNNKTGKLLPEIRPSKKSPPAFIVHTHDDRSSSLGSVWLYAGLKQHNVPAELHIYENGGHGYGMRARKNSHIGTWPDRATDWLLHRRLARRNDQKQ